MTILISILVALAVLLAVYLYFRFKQTSGGSNSLISSAIPGQRQFDSTVVLPESLNQNQGLTFSYTCWLRIDDFSYRYGEQKVIFTKGPTDLSSVCPGLFLDGTTNTLIVKLDTFGAQEVIPIGNIPAEKWIHFGLVVDQDSVDVYINGILKTHKSLSQLPRQNTGTVHVGVGGGFAGKIADLNYYNYFLTPDQIQGSMGSPPTPNQTDVSAPTPPYFDYSWWIGR